MFVQVIRGQVNDAEGFARQGERWQTEVRPGATGFLGSTAGTTADGRTVVLARFASAEDAAANSQRPEQSNWWAEAEKYFEGAPEFHDCTDVEELFGGGSDEAGFVQVMQVQVTDRARFQALDRQFEGLAAKHRPDLLGGLRAWISPDTYVEAAYFTSEADARKGEAQELPADVQAVMGEWQELASSIEFLDLTDPQLH